MPALQVIDNPLANSMSQASQGLDRLNQARMDLEKRRSMRRQMIKDLPPNLQEAALRGWADEAGFSTDSSLTDKILGALSSAKAGISGLVSSKAGLSGIEAQTPTAPAREYDPGKIGSSTIDALADQTVVNKMDGGSGSLNAAATRDALSRGRNATLDGFSDSITYDEDRTPHYFLGGKEVKKETYDAEISRPDREFAARSAKYKADMSARDAKIARAGEQLEKANSVYAQKNDPSLIKKAYDTFNAAKNGPVPVAPTQNAPQSSYAAQGAPQFYDDSAPVPVAAPAQGSPSAVAQAPSPQAPARGGATPVAYSRGNSSMPAGTHASYSGLEANSRDLGAALDDNETQMLMDQASRGGSAGAGFAHAMNYARRLPPEKRDAAEKFINHLFPQQMSPYDNGVMHDQVSFSAGTTAPRGGAPSGGGNGDGGDDGFLVVTSGARSWPQKVTRLRTGDPVTDAVSAMVGTQVHDKKSITIGIQKVYALANQAAVKDKEGIALTPAEIAGKKIMEAATGDLGIGLSQAGLISGRVKQSDLKDGQGFNIGDIIGHVSTALSAKQYSGPNMEENHWFRPNESIKGGEFQTEASITDLRSRTKSNKSVSDIVGKGK